VAAGPKPGQVALAWYGSQNAKDPNDTEGVWFFYVARSDDYGQTWKRATVGSHPFHYGDICTVGIACVSGNRNLLDFSSIGANPKTGAYTVVFPGDPYNTFDREKAGDTDPSAAYIACEGGCGLTAKQQVESLRSGCRDQSAPVSAISRKRSRFTRRGINLRGLTTDKGCGAGGRGQVARETLAISRRVGKRCQWLQKSGRFSRTRSCRKKSYVNANGTSKWTFRRKMRLKRGIYAVVARAIDASGNVERPVRGSRARARHNHNHYVFRVR
jgi:hypothetical protein